MQKVLSTLLACVFASTTLLSALPDENENQMREIQCTLTPIDRGRIHPQGKQGLKTRARAFSSNWSGYVAAPSFQKSEPGSVTYAAGSWIIPALEATPDTTYCAVWVGIDGFTNGTVEQIGTAHNWFQSEQQNFAWFEMYPMGAYEITGFPVEVGDQISVRIGYKGEDNFKLVMFNHTKGVSTIVPGDYTKLSIAQRSSAEWIVEAPYAGGILPLSDFELVTFNYCSAIINGESGSISNGDWVNDQITMVNGNGDVKAMPSELLKNGNCFKVAWEHE